MLPVALVLALSLVPQGTTPDRSTPEKTIAGFLDWKEAMPVRNVDVFKRMLGLEVLGIEHFAGEARETLDAQRARGRRAVVELAAPKIATKVLKRSDNADGSATLEVEVGIARAGAGDRVSRRVMRFEVRKHGDAWLIEKVLRACWSCGGGGKCPECAKSKMHEQKCLACNGTGRCRACEGKGFLTDESHLPKVKLALPAAEPKFTNDWTSAESAAKSYADLMLRRRYEQSKLMKQVVDREVVRLAQWMSPHLMQECRENVAKSAREQEQRYRSAQLTVRKVELAGDKATAIVDPGKGSRWPSVRDVAMQRVDGEWKVVDVRTHSPEAHGKPQGR